MFIKIISKQNYIVSLKRFDFYFVIRDPPSKKKKESQKKKDSVLSCKSLHPCTRIPTT